MQQLRLPKNTDLSLKINAYVRRMVLFYHLWCRTASQGILPQWTQGSSNHSDTNSRTAAYRNRKFGWPTKRSIFIKRSIQERTQPLDPPLSLVLVSVWHKIYTAVTQGAHIRGEFNAMLMFCYHKKEKNTVFARVNHRLEACDIIIYASAYQTNVISIIK